MRTSRIIHPITCALGAVSLLVAEWAAAAPGTLANTPLFLTNRAEPNIFFMVDDSNSMNTEMMTSEDIFSWGGIMSVRNNAGNVVEYKYLFGTGTTSTALSLGNNLGNQNVIPTEAIMQAFYGAGYATQHTSIRGAWRARSYNYNRQFYNPTQNYIPWAGSSNINVAYTDIILESDTTDAGAKKAPIDPFTYNPSTASTYVDITTSQSLRFTFPGGSTAVYSHYIPSYYVWQDTNSNGVVDHDDSHTLIEIKSTTPVCSAGVNATAAQQASGGCMLRDYVKEMRNFANWFAYHRRRELTAKHALSHVINNASNVRMGTATIHNDSSSERYQLNTMNTSPLSGNKKSLLNAVFNLDTTSSTPLFSAVYMAGRYYECLSGNPFGSACAIQKTPVSPATQAAGVCQQNFTVLVTDGDYTDSTSVTGNRDGGTSSSFTGTYYPNGVATSQTFSFDGNPYADSTSSTLADLAMHYYERDLDTALENRVPIICGVDENPAQHMVTYALGFGVTGAIDTTTLPAHPQRGYAPNCTATTGSAFTWHDGTINSFVERVDDVMHAAYNGRGEYLSAQDPQQLTTALSNTIRSISNRIGAASAVTFNASVLSSTTNVYIARFNSTQWSGELVSHQLLTDGSIAVTPNWQSSALMDARNLALSSQDRAIVTYNPGNSASGATVQTGIPFRWDLTKLSATQRDDLRTDSAGALEATASYPVAQKRLDYLRGDRSCEIGSGMSCSISTSFRTRASRQGDLVHSAPIYVGKPVDRYPDDAPFGTGGETYTKFKNGELTASSAFVSGKTAASRTAMVYVGGNDGMLHAFDATTGEEIWAYVPHALFTSGVNDGLHKLTETSYDHRYYVDLTPNIVDAYISLGGASTSWRTVLVGGMRGGGRGLFAVDVTDPDYIIAGSDAATREARAASKILWEFSSADDADMGYSFSQPSVVPLGTSSGIEWYVVVGNGYNSTNTTGTNPYAAKLFLIKLKGPGADGVWDLGTDYYKIDTALPAGTSISEANRNGMSSPATADNDGDGISDRAYAGDMYGRLWAFDLSGNVPGNWKVAYTNTGSPAPLFTATDGDSGAGNRQPITVKPILARHPAQVTITSGGGINLPNILVYFGTGQYLVNGDSNSTSTQTFYGVWDKGVGNLFANRSNATASNIVKQVFLTGFTSQGLRVIDNSNTVDYSTKYGWYMDLPDTGERVVFNPRIRTGLLFFNTLIPSVNPCEYGGSGWLMSVTLTDGQSPMKPPFDIDGNGIVDSNDIPTASGALPGSNTISAAGRRETFNIPTDFNFLSPGSSGNCQDGSIASYQYVTMSDGTISRRLVCGSAGNLKPGRYSWKELPFE